jgi:hypothetical protein
MAFDFIKFAFSAGEISPKLLGRTDLEKYDLGLDLSYNWFVDYRGGLSTRPGTIFIDYIMHDDQPIELVEFKYATNVANTYLLIFGDNYVRFAQEGAYVVEAPKTITGITKANPGVVTATAHGFANGDWVKLTVAGMSELNSRTAVVAGATANTFQLNDVFGNNLNTSAYGTFTSGTASRIYTVATPFAAEDLAGLHFHQYRDLIRITSLDFPPYELIRNDEADWDLALETFGAGIGYPTITSDDPSSSGSRDSSYAVTAVNAEGEESLPSPVYVAEDHDASSGVALFWSPVAGAVRYNVYGSLSQRNDATTAGAQLGYMGRSFGATFDNSNIIPDFTKTPPLFNNPFANGAIDNITITNVGTGYAWPTGTTITVGGGGSGFRGEVIVDSTGRISGVKIINPGSGYVNPTISFTGTGSGATATVTATPMTGNYPALSTIFQQRQIYAASENKPLTVWGSKPKAFANFDVSDIVTDDDSYEFEIDSEDVTPIKHMKAVRGGLLLMTDGGLWLMTGGGNGDAITPTNVLANINTYIGVADVPPISLDTDLLYVESKGFTVRLLEYNDFARVYSGQDISIFSNHFFSTHNYITEWTFADDPFKLVWARRQDGSLLALTANKEQKVFAWTQHWTKGFVQHVATLRQDNQDVVYMAVSRRVNGRNTVFLEMFADRLVNHVEGAFCVDCGLSLGHTYPAATLSFAETDDTAILTASVGVFDSGDVGSIIRVDEGKYRITGYTNSTTVTAHVLRPNPNRIPEDDSGYVVPALSGEWTMDAPVASISGLWHLEGMSLSANVDGNVATGLVVANGTVTLPHAGTMVHIGIPYTCKARTLPLTANDAVVEGRRKRVIGVLPRVHETRGLKAGTTLENLYPMRERTNETPGEPNDPLTGVFQILHESLWDNDGQVYLVQDSPLPASIISLVSSGEIGDDPDSGD